MTKNTALKLLSSKSQEVRSKSHDPDLEPELELDLAFQPLDLQTFKPLIPQPFKPVNLYTFKPLHLRPDGKVIEQTGPTSDKKDRTEK